MAITDGWLGLVHHVVFRGREIKHFVLGFVSRERDRQAPAGLEITAQYRCKRWPELLTGEPCAQHRRGTICPWRVDRVRRIEYHDGAWIGCSHVLDQLHL